MRWFLGLLLACVLCGPANAQLTTQSVGGGFGGAAAYAGPGDIVSGAKAWWGLRCYNTAYTGSVADIFDAATGATTETLLTCSAGGTINQTINTLATTCSGGCVIKTLFDQSGGLNCGGAACNAAQATLAKMPTLTQNFNASGHMCGVLNGTTQGWQGAPAFNFGAIVQPYTASSVAERTGNVTLVQAILQENTNSTDIGFKNAANTVGVLAGTATAADNTAHSLTFVVNGATSTFVVDGSTTSVSIATTTFGGGSQIGIGTDAGATTFFITGNMCEIGIWASAFNATQYGNMHTNQSAWYGTP